MERPFVCTQKPVFLSVRVASELPEALTQQALDSGLPEPLATDAKRTISKLKNS
jgi:hypothetical protein